MDNLVPNMEKVYGTINELKERPSWDEYFMLMATLASKRSSCERLNVGCIITKDNRVICTGYNGHIKGTKHESYVEDGHEQMTVHAEANAIADASLRGIKTDGSTIYITHFSCINCIKMLISAGIKTIYYHNDYKNNELCLKIAKNSNVEIKQFKIVPKRNL